MDPVSKTRLAFNRSTRLTRGLIRWSVAGALLLGCFPGCRTWSDPSDYNVGLHSAWYASNGNDQKIECSYREGWRAGYLDSREGTNSRLERRVPAQFEAFHSHLREQTWSDWHRGYKDGHASAAQQKQQADPNGFHQQAFQTDDLQPNASPMVDPPGTTTPSEQIQPVVPQPAAPTPPTTPEKPKKYIDQDRVAGDWDTLGQSIQRTVNQHNASGSHTRSIASPSTPSITISSPDSASSITLPLTSKSNQSIPSTGTIAEAEGNIDLPAINPQITFGSAPASSVPSITSPTSSGPRSAPELDIPAQQYQPQSDDSDLNKSTPATGLDMELDLIQNYPNTQHQPLLARVSPQTFAGRDLPPIAGNLSKEEAQVRTLAVDSQVNGNQPLASTVELGQQEHQMVDYQSQLGPNNGLPTLAEPRSVILTPQQRIRRQLPSRLPLKRRLPNG